jgi:hypothetical protein
VGTDVPDRESARFRHRPGATNGVWISRPAFKPVSKVDHAGFVLIGSLQPTISHRVESDLMGEPRGSAGNSGSTRRCVKYFTHPSKTGEVLLTPARLWLGNDRATGGVMPRSYLWSQSVPRVELDQRSREARLRLEQIDRLFILRVTSTNSRLRRLLYLFRVGRHGWLAQQGGVKDLLSYRWPFRLPMLFGLWLENTGFCDLPGVFN